MSAFNHFSQQKPILAPLHPNHSSLPQPSLSASILSFSPGMSAHVIAVISAMSLLFMCFHFLHSFEDLIYIQ